MIEGKSVLGIVPARGGSKGVPRKNVRDLAGKPLIAWTIEAAKASSYIDRMILTSDDEEIIQTAKKWGCEVPFVRPKELAADDTPGIEPVIHAIKLLPGYDFIVLLQPTSPLRNMDDIDGCIEKCISKATYSCVSVTETAKSPYWMYSVTNDDCLRPLMPENQKYNRRQEVPKTFVLNGAVYVANTKWLCESKSFIGPKTVAYPMPLERSVDVDTELDFLYIKALIQGDYNANI